MAVYAEVKGTQLIQYPYGFEQLQADNPYTDYGTNTDVAYWFPKTNTAIDNGYTLAEVITSPQPSYDPAHQICNLSNQPVLVNGVWTLDWTVNNFTPEEQAAYDQNQKTLNKNQAAQLLSATDWTTIPDVANSAVSNPYLINQSEFIVWRSQIRAIAVNPPVVVNLWPTKPTEQWSS